MNPAPPGPERDKARLTLETQMRWELYKDVKFPFMQSMGGQNVFKAFGDSSQDIFLGVCQLRWIGKINGMQEWEAIWHDTHEEALHAVIAIDHGFDLNKVNDIVNKRLKRYEPKPEVKEEVYDGLLN